MHFMCVGWFLNTCFCVFTCTITTNDFNGTDLMLVVINVPASSESDKFEPQTCPPQRARCPVLPPTFNGAIMSSVDCEVRGWPPNMHLFLLSCVGWRWRQLSLLQLLCVCADSDQSSLAAGAAHQDGRSIGAQDAFLVFYLHSNDGSLL